MSDTTKGSNLKKVQKTAGKGSSAETVMYVGPNMRGIAVKGTLYQKGKLPVLLRKKMSEMPVLSSLLVPVSKLTQITKDLKDPMSEISICYKNVVEELTKGGSR